MDGDQIIAILALLASAAFVVGTSVFFVWAAQYFGLRAYRRSIRLHLYVLVDAQVTRVRYHTFRHGATIHAEYEFDGTKIVNRLITSHDVARLAGQSMHITLRIDPDYPTEVVVDSAFEKLAAESPKPAGWGMPLGATTYPDYALRLLVSVLLGGIIAIGLGWLKHRKLDSVLLITLAGFLSVLYFACLLSASSRFKASDRNRRDRWEAEQEKRPSN